MKVNYKVFTSLTDEPAVIQQMENKKIEIHFMNDTKYYTQYASRGKLSVWASDGKDFKLLIEKGYYESVPDIYTASANDIWTGYLDALGKVQRNFNLIFIGIALIIVALGITFAFVFDEQYISFIAIGIVLVMSMAQNTILRRKVAVQSDHLQVDIKDLLGEEKFKETLENQKNYYDTFYSRKEEIIVDEESSDTNADQQIEQKDEVETKDE